jgi:hypothetical protein
MTRWPAIAATGRYPGLKLRAKNWLKVFQPPCGSM